MKLAVPEVLKVMLVDDWEAVTKNNQVRLLFCSPGRFFALSSDLVFIASNPPAGSDCR